MRQSDLRTVYGLLKPANDAHTMGLQTAGGLLSECGYEVVIADERIQKAFSFYNDSSARLVIIDWLRKNKINRLGISYRLDYTDAINMLGFLLEELKKERLLEFQNGPIDLLFFGGLPETCRKVEKTFSGIFTCFQGGESIAESLSKMLVPAKLIPRDMLEVSQYDDNLHQFAEEVIYKKEYLAYDTKSANDYLEFGTGQDTLLKRLEATKKQSAHQTRPLIRAHVGPYHSGQKQEEAILECGSWIKQLASKGLLDILSLGTSQLSQSNFAENWSGKLNGGGVPVNSEADYRYLYEEARPLLMRTYAGTKNIPQLARMYENTINISWHALSLWWFNQLDDRGPYDLYTNLKEHFKTIEYIATTNKPLEANVSHHFAFRGADDLTYIVVAYLAAKLAKLYGIKTFVLQNMLNTPRSTWGVHDLAKSRALLRLVRSLEDDNFRIVFQPRAGLDFFKPDLEQAKIQLAAVSCLMDDIEPRNLASPDVIHVVSYSEASHLATPDVINESIQITLHTIEKYREARLKGLIDDQSKNPEVNQREEDLYQNSRLLIKALEKSIPDLYSPEGFYLAFASGFFPVPYLWGDQDKFNHAINWQTKMIRGSMQVVDADGSILEIEQRLARAVDNLRSAKRTLHQEIP
ncbi:MAG: cobalamin-binding protein [Clostridiaceae bacterium]|nr:cobalamin-binding protein [Clostridiaceae bacterium]